MAKKQQYKALTDLYDGSGVVIVAEGETSDKVPAKAVPWLLEQGLIEEVA